MRDATETANSAAVRVARVSRAAQAMLDKPDPLHTITARLEERILQPLRSNGFARRTQLSITVALIVTLYAGLLGWMLARDAADPPKAADVQETSVEVVAAVPPEPAPQPEARQQEPEKPATSAPRAFNDAEASADDKETHAPKAAVPDAAMKSAEAKPSNETSPDAAKPEAPAQKEMTEAPKPPDVPEQNAEALDRLPPEPPKKPATLAAAKPVPQPPRRPKTALQQLAGASDLPDYTFAKPMRKHAKISGGSEDDRYLAVVYGMITQNRRPIRAPDADWSVAVSFVVDGGGNLVGVQVSKSSGYAEIDAAAVQSVEEAAPFPPPPSGGNTGLVARLRSLDSQAMAGDR